ncbi:hypothetical protein PMAYCL1PPCAC_26435, partial [Pristionchus mayeri]
VKEGRFWIDRLKSQCISEMETVAQARSVYGALHGKHWPAVNPKTLNIKFGTQEELNAALAGKSLPDRESHESGGDRESKAGGDVTAAALPFHLFFEEVYWRNPEDLRESSPNCDGSAMEWWNAPSPPTPQNGSHVVTPSGSVLHFSLMWTPNGPDGIHPSVMAGYPAPPGYNGPTIEILELARDDFNRNRTKDADEKEREERSKSIAEGEIDTEEPDLPQKTTEDLFKITETLPAIYY